MAGGKGGEFSPLVQRESVADDGLPNPYAYAANQATLAGTRQRNRRRQCLCCLVLALGSSLLLALLTPLAPLVRAGIASVTQKPATELPAPSDIRRAKPHLIYVLLDDVGHDDFGWSYTRPAAAAQQRTMTPHMDAISASGIRLSRFYTHSMCTATRSALLTGRYAFRLGLQVMNSPLKTMNFVFKLTDFVDRCSTGC